MLYYQGSLNQIRRIHADSLLFDFLMVMYMVIFRVSRNLKPPLRLHLIG